LGLYVINVSKQYGTKTVVENLSFSLSEPGIFGLLGTNGAGKTTTIRMILGILSKDAGRIEWNGAAVTRRGGQFRLSAGGAGTLPEGKGRRAADVFCKSSRYDAAAHTKRVEVSV